MRVQSALTTAPQQRVSFGGQFRFQLLEDPTGVKFEKISKTLEDWAAQTGPTTEYRMYWVEKSPPAAIWSGQTDSPKAIPDRTIVGDTVTITARAQTGLSGHYTPIPDEALLTSLEAVLGKGTAVHYSPEPGWPQVTSPDVRSMATGINEVIKSWVRRNTLAGVLLESKVVRNLRGAWKKPLRASITEG